MLLTRVMGLATGLALGFLASAAVAQDSADVQAVVNPWLDQVEVMRFEVGALRTMWEGAAPAVEPATEMFQADAADFVANTEEVSAELRVIQPGIDAACILHGIALDVTERLGALNEATEAGDRVSVLGGIDRLLLEALLIFGRAEEASLGSDIAIRVAYAQKRRLLGHNSPKNEAQNSPCDAEATPLK